MERRSFTDQSDVDSIGLRLNRELDCPVRFASATATFVCHCGVGFTLEELLKSDDWAWVKEKHDKGTSDE